MDAADLAFAGLPRVKRSEPVLPARPGDEATLLSLSAQLETATGRLERRPRVAA